nr:hypothetical protein [Tanacetum cinerariifolium]
ALTGPVLTLSIAAMKWISRLTRCAIAASVAWSSMTFAATAVDFYFPEAPPLTMANQGDEHGIVGDIALKAMAMAGYAPNFASPPWPRAQRNAPARRRVSGVPDLPVENWREPGADAAQRPCRRLVQRRAGDPLHLEADQRQAAGDESCADDGRPLPGVL